MKRSLLIRLASPAKNGKDPVDGMVNEFTDKLRVESQASASRHAERGGGCGLSGVDWS